MGGKRSPNVTCVNLEALHEVAKNVPCLQLEYLPELIFAKRLGLKSIILLEGMLIGPTFEVAPLIEHLVKNGARTVLDLFCGTGALSLISVQFGAEHVTCVDINIEAALMNLASYVGEKVEVVQCNAYEYKPNRFYDLVIADSLPSITFRKKVAESFLPKLRTFGKTIVIVLGSTYYRSSIKRKARLVNDLLGKALLLDMYGLTYAVHSKDEEIMNSVKQVFKDYLYC